jgi:hypothetical protein
MESRVYEQLPVQLERSAYQEAVEFTDYPAAEDAANAMETSEAMAAAVPSDTPPPVLSNPPEPLQPDFALERKAAVLAMIKYPWERLGYSVEFLGPRPGYRAMTISDKKKIEVYLRPGETPLLAAFDLAHEFGHAFDLEFNNADRRALWRKMRGIDPSIPWFGCNRCPDYETPAGDFAETFAYLLLGPGNYHSRLAAPPSPQQAEELTAFCQIEKQPVE